MYNDFFRLTYSAPVSDETFVLADCLYAASNIVEGTASLEDYEVIDLSE